MRLSVNALRDLCQAASDPFGESGSLLEDERGHRSPKSIAAYDPCRGYRNPDTLQTVWRGCRCRYAAQNICVAASSSHSTCGCGSRAEMSPDVSARH